MSDEPKIALPRSLQEIVGALLFASETPLTVTELREAVRAVEAEEGDNREIMEVYRTCTTKEIEQALRGLEKALEVAGAGFALVCAGGAYRMQTTPSCGRYVRALLKMDRPSRLGRASLETLAIIAYRQPLTRSEIEDIRGVDVSANMKTLMDLQLIRLVGKSELPGHPFLYGTTPLFLEHFGLASLQQLNELDPTLQRSNPRQKALAYKRKDAKPGEELPKGAESENPEAASAEAPTENPVADDGEVDVGVQFADAAGEGENPESEAEGEAASKSDDDDFFIDDTPDEFDDDDDDDEDGEEEESDGEEDEES